MKYYTINLTNRQETLGSFFFLRGYFSKKYINKQLITQILNSQGRYCLSSNFTCLSGSARLEGFPQSKLQFLTQVYM